jgi:hypothetical protein
MAASRGISANRCARSARLDSRAASFCAVARRCASKFSALKVSLIDWMTARFIRSMGTPEVLVQ